MPTNFYYAAYSYLDEWIQRDCGFHQVLAFEKRNDTAVATGTQCLVEVATYYKVIRTLRKTDENPRLKAAYESLEAIERPEESDVIELVPAFAKTLEATYGVKALSAASKFLWMRFRNPVVIYDSVVSRYLYDNCGYRDDGSYSDYYRFWLSKTVNITTRSEKRVRN